MGELIICENVVLFLVITGVIPFSKKSKFRLNKGLLIYCRIVLILISFLQYFMILLHKSMGGKSFFMSAASLANTFGYSFSCLSVLLVIHLLSNSICKLLNEVAELWEKLGPDVKSHYDNKPWTSFMTWNFVIMESLALIMLICSSLKKWTDIIVLTGMVETYFLNHYFLCCDYLFMVLLLNTYFFIKNLNENLSNVCSCRFENNMNVTRTKQFIKETKFFVLRRLNKEYSNVLDMLSRLNGTFSFGNLVSFSLTSSGIMFTIFYFAYQINNKTGLNSARLEPHELIYFIIYFSNKSLICLILVMEVQKEVEHAARLLNNFQFEDDDPRMLDEVEIFSLHLFHRKIDFDAGGFFKLNFSVIPSMINSMATYGIILIQFEFGPVKDPVSS